MALKSWAISPDFIKAQQETSDVTLCLSPFKTLSVALVLTIGAAFAASADEPSPAAIDSARTIIAAWGMTRSFDVVVPQMLEQLERSVTTTRPELKDNLHAVLVSLKPEFAKTEETFIASAAQALAKRLSEQELKEVATFFQTPTGKKYVEAEPAAISEIVILVQSWREKLSVDVLARAHQEMKKKGTDF
jgi:uncharacterized protein